MTRNLPAARRMSPALGAELRGVDARTLDDAGFTVLLRLWQEADGLLVLRDQPMSSAEQVVFTRRFGEIFGDPDTEPLVDTVDRYMHPEWPQIYRVSNKTGADGEPLGRRRAGTYWHSDVSFLPRPAGASLLHAVEIPPFGGDTMFANTAAAYDDLSPAMRAFLADKRAVHDFAVASVGWTHESKAERDGGRTRNSHPVVRTHPLTGRKSLYVNPGFTAAVEGLEPAESRAVLGFLYEHMTRPEVVYRHVWQVGDLVIWDNRMTMHYAIADYPDGHSRYMERTTQIGERPV